MTQSKHAGIRLAEARKARGMTQAGLARELDTTATYCSMLELGVKPLKHSMVVLCSVVLGVRPDWLALGVGPRDEPTPSGRVGDAIAAQSALGDHLQDASGYVYRDPHRQRTEVVLAFADTAKAQAFYDLLGDVKRKSNDTTTQQGARLDGPGITISLSGDQVATAIETLRSYLVHNPQLTITGDVHSRLKEVRIENNIIEAEMAELLGMQAPHYRRLENKDGGRTPGPQTCLLVCALFNVNPAWMFSGTEARDSVTVAAADFRVELSNCHDCGAQPGHPHRIGCDTERCSVCGGQRIQCACQGHDRAFARWTGIWPGAAESAALKMDLNEFCERELDLVFFIKPRTTLTDEEAR